MGLTTLSGHLICTSAAERAAVLAYLPDHIHQTLREPGCLYFDVAQTTDPMVWSVNEAFATRADLKAHQARAATSPWANATTGIRRDYAVESAAPELRPEMPSDTGAVYLLNRAAFGRDDEADLVNALRASGDLILSEVAVLGRTYLGHVGFSSLTAPFRGLALAPVAVRACVRGQGIADLLIRSGIGLARDQGYEGIVVLGDPAYYARFGFSVGAARGFTSRFAGPHLMVLDLTRAGLPTTGTLTHAPAFDALG